MDFYWRHSFRGTEPRAWHKHGVWVWVPATASLDEQWDLYYHAILLEKRRWWQAILRGEDPMHASPQV